MFDLVHKNKRLVQIFLGLIALTFVTWGIESYTTMRAGRNTVATVNGMEISAREFEEELRRRQDQLRQMLGANYDHAQFDTPDMRRGLLDSLISQRLVASAAGRSNLTVTDEALLDAIHSIPAFKGPDGSFSKSTYEQVLRQQNPPMSPPQFESRLRYELSLNQLTRAVGESAIASRTVAERLAAIEAQSREISEHRILTQQFLPQVKIDEAKLKAYYDENPAQFQVPERVKAEYVVLSGEAMAAQESVSPQEVRAQWESAHGPKLREKEEARKKAQEIAAAVRKNPASFAEVAKRESQDPGSKDAGGDLGFAPRGSFVKPYEDALFRMKEGQISEPIETEFGFHVIQATGVQKKDGRDERRSSHILITAPAEAKPFEAMRDQIEAELKKGRAAKRFGEAADQFQNMVYEQPDSLKPVAERFKLKIETSGWIEPRRLGQGARRARKPEARRRALFIRRAQEPAQHRRDRGRARHARRGARGRAPAGGAAQVRRSEERHRDAAAAARSRRARAQGRHGEARAAAQGRERGREMEPAEDRFAARWPEHAGAGAAAGDVGRRLQAAGLRGASGGRRGLHAAAHLEGDRRRPEGAALRRGPAAQRRRRRRRRVPGLRREPAPAGRHRGQPARAGTEVIRGQGRNYYRVGAIALFNNSTLTPNYSAMPATTWLKPEST